MKVPAFALISFLFSVQAMAALPPQFSECMSGDSSSISTQDVRDIAKVSKVTYCQNQMGLTNKFDTLDMLRNKNIQVGISIAKTSYLREDLMDLAKAGSYVLYVDSNRIAKEYLMDLQRAGVQLVVMTGNAGLVASDLRDMARVKSYVLNVNSPMVKEDLKTLVDLGVQVVIRSNQSALAKEDIVEIAKVNPDNVSIMP